MSSTLLRQAPNPSSRPDGQAGRLFEKHSDRIHAFCLRRLGCPSEAEDAVQTTFLYAHRALQRGVVPESESAWLFAIAKNVCRSQRRALARRGSAASNVDVDLVASPEPFEDGHELLDGLENALATIPEKQRHALLLREWRGLTSSEVASHLGLSGPATYALLTRARRSVARAITAAARPALSIASLVYELQSQLKALFGGVTAKGAATAAVAVAVTVTVGGVPAGGARDEGRLPTAPTEPVWEGAAAADRAGGDSSFATTATSGRTSSTGAAITVNAESAGLRIGTAEGISGIGDPVASVGGTEVAATLPRPDGTSARAARPSGILDETIPEPELPPLPDLELPALPDLGLAPPPDVEVPPLPDVELPPVPDADLPLVPDVAIPGEAPVYPPLGQDPGLPLSAIDGSGAPELPPAPGELLP